ncbi:hypothetical protein X942_5537 [Burkholderia pseudomallei MSHR5596]|nr:hypothetical protein X942_5537 [Burkholderia pseudomallei MSHR5596]KGW80294.1 hypothetical protein Y046_6321 [Burkholderia pseudomallei MSHR2990]
MIPPTGTNGTERGSTLRQARNTAGVISSAGNTFSASAPAWSAANASVSVDTPGAQTMPACFVALMMEMSACGITISRPPASRTRSTSAAASTVPAPIRQSAPSASTIRPMLSNGSGEFSGTSMHLNPIRCNTLAIGTASSGTMPRRIAINGKLGKLSGNGMRCSSGIEFQ